MSIPTKDTTYGDITIEGKSYKIFNVPLGNERINKILQYREKITGVVYISTWMLHHYSWIIENNKLYLTAIRFSKGKEAKNHIYDIFATDKLFAQWYTGEIKALISQESFDIKYQRSSKRIKRRVKLLKFQNGELLSSDEIIEEFTMRKSLEELGFILE